MSPGMVGSIIGSIGGMVGLFLGLLGSIVGLIVGGVDTDCLKKCNKCNAASVRPCIERTYECSAAQGTAHNSTAQSTTDSGTVQKTPHDGTEKGPANNTVRGTADDSTASPQKTP